MEDKVAEQEAELVAAKELAAGGARVRVEEAEGQAAWVALRLVLVDIASVRHVANEPSTNEGSLVLIKNVPSVALR
jgi:hypothetical protein